MDQDRQEKLDYGLSACAPGRQQVYGLASQPGTNGDLEPHSLGFSSGGHQKHYGSGRRRSKVPKGLLRFFLAGGGFVSYKKKYKLKVDNK